MLDHARRRELVGGAQQLQSLALQGEDGWEDEARGLLRQAAVPGGERLRIQERLGDVGALGASLALPRLAAPGTGGAADRAGVGGQEPPGAATGRHGGERAGGEWRRLHRRPADHGRGR